MSNNETIPSYYAGDGIITCKDAEISMLTNSTLTHIQDHWRCEAFEHLWRADKKCGLEDLEKAKQNIEFIIEDIKATQAPKGVLTER